MDSLKNWITNHPNLSAWFVLALGMVILLVYEARDVGLQGSQWFWLIAITILVAGPASGLLAGGTTTRI